MHATIGRPGNLAFRFIRFFIAGTGMMLVGACSSAAPGTRQLAPIYYPDSPALARVVAVGPIGGLLAAKSPPSGLRRFLTGEREDDWRTELVRPLSVAVRDGELLVCDVGLEAAVRIDPFAGTIRPIVRADRPQPIKPVAITVDGEGFAFIADVGGASVIRVSQDGTVGQRYSLPDSKSRFEPVGVAVFAGKLYAIDRTSQCIEIFDVESGRALGRLGTGQGAERRLGFPVALSVDSGGRLYVADMLSGKVFVYDVDGRLSGGFGLPGDGPGQFARPRSVAVGEDGIVYVSDSATQVVQMFDSAGRYLMHFGGPGADSGAMTLPAGLCLDRTLLDGFADRLPEGFVAQYLILVANQFGPGRIGLYAFGRFPRPDGGGPAGQKRTDK